MMRPMTGWQKLIAYSSLAFILAMTLFGGFAIWVLLTTEA